MNDPSWQGVRENVEHIMNAKDWAETTFAANIVFEPLVGELFRGQFAMRFAPLHGDSLTSSVIGVSEREFNERDLCYTREMFTVMGNGEENRQLRQEWLSRWLPYSIAAAKGMAPIWSEHEPVSFEESYKGQEQVRGHPLRPQTRGTQGGDPVSERPNEERFQNDRTSSNRCGVTMSASVEGNAIAEVMGEKPDMIRVLDDRLEFDMEEIAEALGEPEFTTYDFEIETSTHYGRMVRLDDQILLFANPEDAAEYLGFELPEVKQ